MILFDLSNENHPMINESFRHGKYRWQPGRGPIDRTASTPGRESLGGYILSAGLLSLNTGMMPPTSGS
jgi:hypothetical protein